MARRDHIPPFDVDEMSAFSASVLDAFGVCVKCGAEHEPPRGEGCLFADEHETEPPVAAE